MAGYSNTPLLKKLGFKPGMSVCLINTPENYSGLLGDLPEDCRIFDPFQPEMDLIHLFVTDMEDLLSKLGKAKDSIKKNGVLWVSWPKKTSEHYKDLDGNSVREAGLSTGLVDIKVCAVDDTWSALKFVYRLEDR